MFLCGGVGEVEVIRLFLPLFKKNVEMNGETYQKDVVHKMDEAFISRLSNEAFELSGMFPTVTPEEVDQMADLLKSKGNAVYLLSNLAEDSQSKEGIKDPHLAHPLRNPNLQDQYLQALFGQ